MADSWSARCRAPLLWILFPIIIGFLFGRYGGRLFNGLLVSPKVLAGGGVILAILALILVFTRKARRQWLWSLVLFATVVCLSWSYFLIIWPKPSTKWEATPPREAELTLKVTRVFNTSQSSNYRAGIGTVMDAPKRWDDLLGRSISFGLKTNSMAETASFIFLPSAQFRVKGVLSFFDESTAPSSFHQYLNRRGIYFELKKGRMIKVIDIGHPFFRFCHYYHKKFESFLQLGNEGNERFSNIIVAMLLGKKKALSDEQKTTFLMTGTLHFFAISGLHIGVIALLFFSLLGLLRLPKILTGCLGLLLVLLYVYITGAGPSALRAFAMISFFWCAVNLQRKPAFFSALIVSAIVVLLSDPSMLWNIGFQLSYSVVAGIFLYGLPLTKFLQERFVLFKGLPEENWQWYQQLSQRVWNVFLGLLAISLSAALMSTPLTIHYFSLFPIGGILLNILMAPLASLAIISGMLSILSGLLGVMPLTVFFNHGGWLTVDVMEHLTTTLARVPVLFTQRIFIFPWVAFVILFVLFLLLTLWHSEERLRYRFTYVLPFIFLGIMVLFVSKSVSS